MIIMEIKIDIILFRLLSNMVFKATPVNGNSVEISTLFSFS